MEPHDLIRLELICRSYDVEPSFIDELFECGLIKLIEHDNDRFIEASHIHLLESMIHLHYDLDINVPGIETIHHLVERVEALQEEIRVLKNRLLQDF